MRLSRSLLGLAALAAAWGLILPSPAQAKEKAEHFKGLVKAKAVHARQTSSSTNMSPFGLNEKGDPNSLGLNALGQTATQWDAALLKYYKHFGNKAPKISQNQNLSKVDFMQSWLLARFSLAAAFNANGVAGGVVFSPSGTPIAPVSPVNVYNYFPVFTQFPDSTGTDPNG